jgi:hypothetical protein
VTPPTITIPNTRAPLRRYQYPTIERVLISGWIVERVRFIDVNPRDCTDGPLKGLNRILDLVAGRLVLMVRADANRESRDNILLANILKILLKLRNSTRANRDTFNL